MTARKLRFLQLLLTGPQTLSAFTSLYEGNTKHRPSRALQQLEMMQEDGTVACSGGVFSITVLGREDLAAVAEKAPAAAAAPLEIVPPRLYGNFSMPRDSLRLNYPAPARASADQHKSISSRGM